MMKSDGERNFHNALLMGEAKTPMENFAIRLM